MRVKSESASLSKQRTSADSKCKMEQYFVYLAVIFSILSPTTSESNEWIKERFPNPLKDKNTCGRRGVFSWICDPDAILSYEDANILEEMLQSVSLKTKSGCSINSDRPGYQIGVAVMKKMAVPSEMSKEDVAQDFAKHLHNEWGVGSSGCDDGVLLLLSVEDRQIFISTGRTAKKQLSDDQISLIIDKMKTPLREKQYGRALCLAAENMHLVFDGKRLESNLFYLLFSFVAFLPILLMYFIDPDLTSKSLRITYGVCKYFFFKSHKFSKAFSRSGSGSLGSGRGGRGGSW